MRKKEIPESVKRIGTNIKTIIKEKENIIVYAKNKDAFLINNQIKKNPYRLLNHH